MAHTANTEAKYTALWKYLLVLTELLVAVIGVQLTHAISSVGVHLFYIPVITAFLTMNVRFGYLTALLAGLFMLPVHASNGDWLVWAFRVGMIFVVGIITANLTKKLQQQITSQKAAKERLETTLEQTVRALTKAVDARHTYTANHSERVANYAAQIARYMQLSERDLQNIIRASFLHDLGKIGIRWRVLEKPGPLTPEEWVMIKLHPITSADIVNGLVEFQDLVPFIRGHHERWDGTGYPDGLKGEQISLLARILAVADAWDAMTTDRVYRKAYTQIQALHNLLAGSGSQFDPQIVQAFVGAMGLDEDAALYSAGNINVLGALAELG